MKVLALCCHPDGCECATEDGDAVCAFHAEVLGYQARYIAVPVAEGQWNGFHVDRYLTNRDAILEQARADYWSAPDVARAKARRQRVKRAGYLRVYEKIRKSATASLRKDARRAVVAVKRSALTCEDCKGLFAPKSMTGRMPRFCPGCAHQRQLAITRDIKRAKRFAMRVA